MVQRKRAFLRRERVSRAELRRGHDDEYGRENHDDDDFGAVVWCGKGVLMETILFIYEQTDRQTDTGRAMYFLRVIVRKRSSV